MNAFLFFILVVIVVIQSNYGPVLGIARGINILNITMYFVGIYTIGVGLVSGKIQQIKIPGLKILLIMFGYLCVSSGLNLLLRRTDNTLYEEMRIVKAHFFEPMLLYVIPFLLIDNLKSARKYLKLTVVIFAIVNILYLLSLKYNFALFSVAKTYEGTYRDRFSGSFGNPNQMAYLLSALIPFLYYYYKSEASMFTKTFFVIIIMTSCASIVLSGSRGGFLSLGIVMLSLVILIKDFKAFIIISSMLAVFVGVALSYNFGLLQSSLDRLALTTSSDINVASAGRSVLWKASFDIYLSDFSYIFIGTGNETSQGLIFAKTKIPLPPHNRNIQILMELGIVGFIIWLFFLGYFYRYISGFHYADSTHRLFQKVTLVACSIIVVGWMFSDLGRLYRYIPLVFTGPMAYLYYAQKMEM